jgi:hypothetical protein
MPVIKVYIAPDGTWVYYQLTFYQYKVPKGTINQYDNYIKWRNPTMRINAKEKYIR